MFAPVNTAVNVGSAHIQGVETELTLRLSNWLALQASYTFTDAQNADDGSRLLRRPQNTAAFNATITPLPGLTIAPELLITGAFQDFLVDNGGNATGDDRLVAARRDRQPHRHLRCGAACAAVHQRAATCSTRGLNR